MAFINDKLQEINCKIIYYGPPLSGKRTTLYQIAKKISPENKLESLSKHNSSLYFDFIPIMFGLWRGYKVRLHLYTAPHDAGYYASHQLISTGADAVIFVADSDPLKLEDNIAALNDLKRILYKQHDDIPIIIQYNKRDRYKAVPVQEISIMLNTKELQEFESVASKGEGVMEPLFAAAKEALKNLKI